MTYFTQVDTRLKGETKLLTVFTVLYMNNMKLLLCFMNIGEESRLNNYVFAYSNHQFHIRGAKKLVSKVVVDVPRTFFEF